MSGKTLERYAQLKQTGNSVIDVIMQGIYDEFLNDRLDVNTILDLMISINYTGVLRSTLFYAYIGLPKEDTKIKVIIDNELFQLIRTHWRIGRSNMLPENLERYDCIIINELNRQIRKFSKVLQSTDRKITELIHEYPYAYIERSKFMGYYVYYMILLSHKPIEDLKDATPLLQEYKNMCHPGSYVEENDDVARFTCYL